MPEIVKPRIALILIAIAISAVWLFCDREPRYQGRTLTGWLWQYYCASLEETNRLGEAQNAVRAIGAKKAVPKLLNLVQAKDGPVDLWLTKKTRRFRDRLYEWDLSPNHSLEDFERAQWPDAERIQMLGVRGFEILGTNAAPAVEALGKILNEKSPDLRQVQVIEWSLEGIGKPAEPVICRALTNSNPAIRQWAIDELAAVTDDVEVYVARIKPRLHDSSVDVRGTAVDAIGAQTKAPDLAIPLLLQALNDSPVSVNAANALAGFGTNALIAFPALTNLIENENDAAAGAALRAAIIISPENAFPVLTNCIARKKPGTDEALKSLAEVAPEKAWPLVLNQFQSSDAKKRQFAFRILCRYPLTPSVEAAMKTAADDSEFSISMGAKQILTDQYQREHPIESLFADDPEYDGKSLGEWLKMRDRENVLPTPATNAIYQIGTNAIPMLLRRLTYQSQPFGLPTREGNEIRMEGLTGFVALGNRAVFALPELESLMGCDNPDIALFAMTSSLGTGTNAIPILEKGLTNQFADIRGAAAQVLAETIAPQFPERRDEIIPLLQKLLDDSDHDVRQNVKGCLRELNATNVAAVKM